MLLVVDMSNIDPRHILFESNKLSKRVYPNSTIKLYMFGMCCFRIDTRNGIVDTWP